MKRLRLAVVSLAVLAAMIARAATAAPAAEAFARLPTFDRLALSPDGSHLAVRINQDNRYHISVFDIAGDKFESVYAFEESGDFNVEWFRWAADDKLLISVEVEGENIRFVDIAADERRLFCLNFSGDEPKLVNLFGDIPFRAPIYTRDVIVSLLPDDDRHLLVQYFNDETSAVGVFRVDSVREGRHEALEPGTIGVLNWMADRDGNVRLGMGHDRNYTPFLIVRDAPDSKWRDLSHRAQAAGVRFEPLEFAAEPSQLFVASTHEGQPAGLYLFNTATDEFGPLLYRHESSDVTSVDLDDKSAELVSIRVTGSPTETVWLASRPVTEDIDRLARENANLSVHVHEISRDGTHAILRVHSQGDGGRFLIYDKADDLLRSLPAQYSKLDGQPIAETFATGYAASDGLNVPAAITLPPGLASLAAARELPFIVRPHGGPGTRDLSQFDYVAQFLASRGYGVMQMNLRDNDHAVSAEAGESRAQAAQQAIVDGVDWLVESGWADASRIAIAGESYGGYDALMAAANTPDRYRCTVAFAAVSDLSEFVNRREWTSTVESMRQFINAEWPDERVLTEYSPLHRAADIRSPVLLLHGSDDVVVDVGHSKRMARSLKKADVDHRLVVLRKGDHEMSRYDSRLRYLKELEKFLGKCLAED